MPGNLKTDKITVAPGLSGDRSISGTSSDLVFTSPTVPGGTTLGDLVDSGNAAIFGQFRGGAVEHVGTSTEVTFATPFQTDDYVITVTPTSLCSVFWFVSDKTASGFTLNTSSSVDCSFDWLAKHNG